MAMWTFYQNKMNPELVRHSHKSKLECKWKLAGVLVALFTLFLGAWFIGLWFLECQNSSRSKNVNIRLPQDIKPFYYKLKLIPFIWAGNSTFYGEVKIDIDVLKSTNKIHLHAVDLDIWKNATRVEREISPRRSELINVTRQYYDAAKQVYVIETEDTLKHTSFDQYSLLLKFTGKLNDHPQGLYKSSYVVNNETRWIVASQFKPTGARRVFPCFDEPNPESDIEFDIEIAHPKNMTAISNKPLFEIMPHVEGMPEFYQWSSFGLVDWMSINQVAFVVLDFEKINCAQNENIIVWARKDVIDKAKYASDIAPKILKYYENFLDYHLFMYKIDLVALPADLPTEVTGGFGLITFRESSLLYDEATSSALAKQEVVESVARGLAYQWFGKWITISWWSDVLLTEGFARYFENVGVNAAEPNWEVSDQLVVQEMQNVFDLDASQSSHPISVEVGHNDEISGIFDQILFAKGVALVRMMNAFLRNDQVFLKAFHNLSGSSYFRCVTTDKFWKYLETAAKKFSDLSLNIDVKKIMDNWTMQTGFPVVTVDRDYKSNEFHITQERFKFANDSSKDNETEPLWFIPLTYTYPSNLNFTNTKSLFWMNKSEIQVPSQSNFNEWVIFNVMQTGYYRVNYDDTNWQKIIAQLHGRDFDVIGTINRAQLVDDALNLARAGQLDYPTALDLLSYLSTENEYLPWKSALVGMSFLDSMLVHHQDYEFFRNYTLTLLNDVYETVGFQESPDDTHLVNLTRTEIMSWACTHDHQDCVSRATKMFDKWLRNDKNQISPNLKSVVYCTGVRLGGETEWNLVWQRYLDTKIESEKQILLNALGCTRKTWLLYKLLWLSVTEDSGIRKQDVTKVFEFVSSNVYGRTLVFDFVKKHWSLLKTKFESTISNIVNVSFGKITTEYDIESLQLFKKKHRNELGSATRFVEQAIEQGRTNIEWLERNKNTIFKWLKNKV